MSQTIRNGQSIRVNIQTGEKLTAVAVTGTYSITVLAGTGTGTSLATSATGGTYGPYAYPLVVQIVASASSEIDYDAGVTTSIESDTVALLKTDPLTGMVTGLVGPDGGTIGIGQISKKLLSCIPAREISTRFNDVSGLGNNLIVEGGNSGAFTTEGYFTTTASTTGGLNIPQSQIAWNPFTQSLIVSFVLKRAVPGANENIFSVAAPIASYQGFYLSHRSGLGKLKIVGVKNDGALVAQADSTLAFSDGTPRDRVVTVAYDAPTGSWYLWRDGVLSDSYVGAQAPGGANTFTNATSSAELRIGALAAASGNACVVVSGYGLQIAKYVGSLPTNIGVIAAKLAEVPRLPIAGVDLP